ncbi:unnamed protein product [Paramecium primaurelia]|uniref:Uncharacterized protein n=1 Tax=Paramecium primaurelia TaxID=5886 RepID=A0A8S1JRG6_PARPR|nr:unnamed protein product [Paramecium primaurelia]
MALKNIIDLTDGVILRYICTSNDSRIDINIFIGIVCRLTIFTILIIFKDIKQYSIGELIVWFIVWLVQHIYILCIEKNYIILGESKVLRREIEYKIMDSLQLLIGIIFLSLNLNSYIEILILVLFSIYFLLNFYIIIFKIKIKEGYTENFQKQGGVYQFYIGFLFGAVWQYLKYQNTLSDILIITMIGQFILVVFSFIIFCRHKSKFLWSNDLAKGILGIFYGIKVGIFSIFYGFIVGCLLIIWYIWEFCLKKYYIVKKKKRQETEEI